jgi:MSHA biogenesis protein MshJ
MKAAIAAVRARYERLTRRERGLAIAAATTLILGLGHLLLVDPVAKRRAALERQITTQQAERDALRVSMAGGAHDRNTALRSQLDTLRTQLRATDREFDAIRNGLVQPQHMGALLQSLLTEHRGLQLLGLRSLRVTPVGAPAAIEAKPVGAPPAASTTNDAWLFRHGVEIRVQGSYADMVGYLQALENLPRRVHWGDLEIDARRHPVNVMTVTIYTVSLEKSWWVL